MFIFIGFAMLPQHKFWTGTGTGTGAGAGWLAEWLLMWRRNAVQVLWFIPLFIQTQMRVPAMPIAIHSIPAISGLTLQIKRMQRERKRLL